MLEVSFMPILNADLRIQHDDPVFYYSSLTLSKAKPKHTLHEVIG